eukprot:5256307-Prymnesium_polylepis.1
MRPRQMMRLNTPQGQTAVEVGSAAAGVVAAKGAANRAVSVAVAVETAVREARVEVTAERAEGSVKAAEVVAWMAGAARATAAVQAARAARAATLEAPEVALAILPFPPMDSERVRMVMAEEVQAEAT